MHLIEKYFSTLSDRQLACYGRLMDLYNAANQAVNVISRKDIQNLYERHVLHSMAIGRFLGFKAGTTVLDLGTGGGFPGIPLAILFPEVHFHMIDGTGKKVRVVQDIIRSLQLPNASVDQVRAEDHAATYDFVVSRAVAKLPQLVQWSRRLISSKQQNAIPNGLIALKGGQIDEEIEDVRQRDYVEATPIRSWFDRSFFDEKFVIYVQLA